MLSVMHIMFNERRVRHIKKPSYHLTPKCGQCAYEIAELNDLKAGLDIKEQASF